MVIVDDGGAFTGFIAHADDNLLGNFTSNSALQYPEILKRLEVRYKGHFEGRLLKALMLEAEGRSVQVDGDWLGHLAKEEDVDDLSNSRIISHLNLSRPYENIIVKDEDVLPLMRLHSLNKSLVYLHELKIDSLLTEAETQVLLSVKISHYIDRVSDKGVKIFKDILDDKQFPDLTAFYLKGLLNIEDIINLRESFEGKMFRKWLENEKYDKRSIYSTLLSSNTSLKEKLLVKGIRWVYPKAAALITQIPGTEEVVKVIDSVIVEKILQGWHPNFFLDKKLSAHLNKLTVEAQKKKQIEREIRVLGRRSKRKEE